MRSSLILAALLVGTSTSLAHAEPSIRWHSDAEAALDEGRRRDRPILLHFWSPDCLPCRRLDQTVFPDADVVKTVNGLFVPVKINAQESPTLAARFQIRSVPKDVVITPDGEELHRMLTPQSAGQYVAQLSAVAYRWGVKTEQNLPDSNGALADRRWPGDASQNGRLGSSAAQRPTGEGPQGPRSPHRSSDYPPRALVAQAQYPSGERQYSAGDQQRPYESEPQEVINRYATAHRAGPSTAAHSAGRPSQTNAIAPGTDSPYASGDQANRPASDRSVAAPEGRRPEGNSNPSRSVASSPQQSVAPVQRQAAAQKAPIGLDGYCPVTLLKDEKWRKGDKRFGVIHRGRTYLFVGEAEKNMFFADPDTYSPVLAGVDPVNLVDGSGMVEGQRAHGVVYQKRVYLFANEANLKRFWQQPERYASPIRQAMQAGTLDRLFR